MTALISVGIDIGTTTMHMVVSRLTLGNLSKPTEIGRVGITDKQILFSSPIYLTPLDSDNSIDARQAAKLLARMFALAPLSKFDSGAVIITGESAAKRNAESVLREIAELAGDFVVESAGAALESIYCARGSGARAHSQTQAITVLNIDIGGGTSNFALIKDGEIISVDVLDAGGRAIKFENGKISSISHFAASIIKKENLFLEIGCDEHAPETKSALERLAALMCEAIRDKSVEMQKAFAAQNPEDVKNSEPQKAIDLLYFSGGVAALMQERDSKQQPQKDLDQDPNQSLYCDLGPELARAISRSLNRTLYKDAFADQNTDRNTDQNTNSNISGWPTLQYKIADDPIRATVLGAGMHALQLSGSTIAAPGQSTETSEDGDLPLKNLPLIKIDVSNPQLIPIHIHRALAQKELDWSKEKIAIAACGLTRQDLQYETIKRMAQQLALAYREQSAVGPLVVILDHDVAMALAQLLKRILPDKRIITVDGIAVQDGDYLDIGKPVNRLSDPNTVTLPVIVKTLVFYKN